MRFAYADPPYPGMAHRYPENTEVDHLNVEDGDELVDLYPGTGIVTKEFNRRCATGALFH